MTAREQFIRDAIKGGYEKSEREGFLRSNGNHKSISYEVILLDPLAWQAVGKVRGWGSEKKWEYNGARWLENMHGMIDRLTEGKSIEEYLADL